MRSIDSGNNEEIIGEKNRNVKSTTDRCYVLRRMLTFSFLILFITRPWSKKNNYIIDSLR